MDCLELQKRLKASVELTEEEKKHISCCEKCRSVVDDMLEEKIKTAGKIIKKDTQNKKSNMSSELIMDNIKFRLGKKIEIFNFKIFALITLVVLVFTFSSYMYFKSNHFEVHLNESGDVNKVDILEKSQGVYVFDYYDEVKGQKGYLIKTQKDSKTSIKGGYQLFIGENSELTCVYSAINIKKGSMSLKVSDISRFIRVNCDDLFFFNSKDCNVSIVRDENKATLRVDDGLLEFHINDRFILISKGEKVIVDNNRRITRLSIRE